ncbi:hypothetical protein GQ53DRAFT_764511 [Thozetella sp. PMI_491]|nr:hypothetical protein GQ53DRAFT_764511 [Thozetella sp. PMI_491]
MAEIFGPVASALSVAALFNNAETSEPTTRPASCGSTLLGCDYLDDTPLSTSTTKPEDLTLFDPATNTNQTALALRRSMQELARKRQKRTGLSKKISWALYKQKHLTQLLDNIQELLGLESVFPRPEAFKRMVEVEVKEIGDVPKLQFLLEAAQDDSLLREAADKKMGILGGNTIDKAHVLENAKVRVGNDSTRNIAHTTEITV